MSLLGEASFDKFVFLRDLLFSLFSLSISLLFVFFFSSFRFFSSLRHSSLIFAPVLFPYLLILSFLFYFIPLSITSIILRFFYALSMHCSKVFLHYWEDSFRLQTIMFTQMQKIFTYRKLTKHISKMFAGISKECL